MVAFYGVALQSVEVTEERAEQDGQDPVEGVGLTRSTGNVSGLELA